MFNQPIFVCGALRSGSTMLHLLLDSHPQLHNPGEFDFLFERLDGEGNPPSLSSYIDWLQTHRIFQSKELAIPQASTYKELVEGFMQQLYKSDSQLLLNTHRNFDRIPSLFPNAKYIHLVRDPRDVARSSIGMGWVGNVYYGVDHWVETEVSWKRLKAQLDADQFLEIKFEELVTQNEKVLSDICQFSGVEFSNIMLNYDETSNYEKPDPSLVYQWKRKLSHQEIQYVELKVNDLIRELDYEESGLTSLELTMLDRVRLYLENVRVRAKFSINRYGVKLFLLSRLTRRLKLKKWNKKIQQKINSVDVQHLR